MPILLNEAYCAPAACTAGLFLKHALEFIWIKNIFIPCWPLLEKTSLLLGLGAFQRFFVEFKSLSNCSAVARRALAIDLSYTEQPFSDILGISCWSTRIKQEEQVYNLLDWHLGVLCDLLAAQNSDLTSPIVQSVGDQLKITASLLFNCSNILGTLREGYN